MAYNNYFPVGYQPATYQQPIYAPYGAQNAPNTGDYSRGLTNTQQAQNVVPTGIIWVQGEAGAKSYLVAPNTTVQLWDSESQTIYLKSADASGMPSIKTLDYTIREMPNNDNRILHEPQVDMSKYVTWDALEEKLNTLKPKTKAKEVKADE